MTTNMTGGSSLGPVKSDRALRWPWAISIAAVLLLGVAIILTLVNDTFGLFVVVAAMMVVGYGVVGAFLATRVPRNPIGWLMIAMAASFAIVGVGDEYVVYSLDTSPGSLPLPEVAAWVNAFAFYGVLLPILVILLVFPDGTVMSPRWRVVLVGVLTGGGLLILSAMVSPGPIGETGVDNPLGIESLDGVTSVLNIVGGIVLLASALAAVTSLAVRYRRAPSSERRQIRPLALIAAIALGIILIALALPSLSRASDLLFTAFFALIGVGVPLAIQNAVMRHRLYELDVVIRKTVVFAIVVVLSLIHI